MQFCYDISFLCKLLISGRVLRECIAPPDKSDGIALDNANIVDCCYMCTHWCVMVMNAKFIGNMLCVCVAVYTLFMNREHGVRISSNRMMWSSN